MKLRVDSAKRLAACLADIVQLVEPVVVGQRFQLDGEVTRSLHTSLDARWAVRAAARGSTASLSSVIDRMGNRGAAFSRHEITSGSKTFHPAWAGRWRRPGS